MTPMFGVTRRQFLKRTGAFAAIFGLPLAGHPPSAVQGLATALGTSFGIDELSRIAGRAFTRIETRDRPAPTGEVLGTLMPDGVYPIVGLSGDGWWYQLAEGFVPREALQPILPYSPPPVTAEPGYYEVVVPVTSLREYCAGAAPIAARLAFGAVVYVHDWLTDDHGQVWYEVSGSQGGAGLFGWASALHVKQWRAPDRPLVKAPTLWIDAQRHKLTVYDGDRPVGETAIYCGPLLPGAGKVVSYSPCMWTTQPPFIRSWVMALTTSLGKSQQMFGAFWHNRFGMAGEGSHIELPTFAAKWLYSMVESVMGRDVTVIIE